MTVSAGEVVGEVTGVVGKVTEVVGEIAEVVGELTEVVGEVAEVPDAGVVTSLGLRQNPSRPRWDCLIPIVRAHHECILCRSQDPF